MSPVEPRRNLAARMGRWSAAHKKTAILGWLAFVVLALALGGAIGTKQLAADKSGSGESGHVNSVLADHFKRPQEDTVLIHSATRNVDDPAFRATVADLTSAVRAIPVVKDVRSPHAWSKDAQVSADGHSVRVTIRLKTIDLDKAQTTDLPVAHALAAVAARHPGIDVEEFGMNAYKQIDDAVGKDFMKAGVESLPITLLVLVIVFGALVAAGLPLLLALTSVAATMGILAIPSRLLPLDQSVDVIVLLIGLAVGVDYAMFYLKREREERAAGRSASSALEAAASTSGRAVLASGLTVMVAMAGMLFTGDKTFIGFGMAAMIVVAIAVVGSLTVLPATMAALGDKVEKLRVPFIHRSRRSESGGRLWAGILDRVLRRPVISAVVAGGFLLALAAPALNLHIADPGFNTMPQNLSSVQTYNKLQKAFPQSLNSVQVMIRTADAHSTPATTAINALERNAIASGQFTGPATVDYNSDGTIALVSMAMQGEGADTAATDALHTLRQNLVPATVGRLPNADVGVTGATAQERDSNGQMAHAAPYVLAFVLTLAFVLMLLTFRSIVIAAKAVVLNLLSVGAAYGALVLVFQYGWGKNLLGFDHTGGIVGFLPIFLFVILFGLSMDYHVFILSRIREAHAKGLPTDQAIAHGIKSSAGVVTSAAIVMVGVFSIFASLQFMFLKQFGVGLAIAVLVDATIVRAVLLPASMKLLGDWNWYLPRWLEWLPRLGHVESAEPIPPAPAHPSITPVLEPVDA